MTQRAAPQEIVAELAIVHEDDGFWVRLCLGDLDKKLGPFAKQEDAQLYYNYLMDTALKAGATQLPDHEVGHA